MLRRLWQKADRQAADDTLVGHYRDILRWRGMARHPVIRKRNPRQQALRVNVSARGRTTEMVSRLRFDAPSLLLSETMTNKRRRFCPSCSIRISRSAKQCHNCGRVTLPWMYYIALACLGITSVVALFKFYL